MSLYYFSQIMWSYYEYDESNILHQVETNWNIKSVTK